MVDLERGGASRLANAPGQNNRPVFSPDSERVAFSERSRRPARHVRDLARGSPPEQSDLPIENAGQGSVVVVAGYGRFLVYRDVGPSTSWDLWTRPTSGDGSPAAFVQGPATETNGAISPDGRWMVVRLRRNRAL
jgi:Tol biopolymer transport system component